MLKVPPKHKPIAIVVSLLVISVCLFFVFKKPPAPDRSVQYDYFIGVGTIAADELASRVPVGARVVIITHDTQDYRLIVKQVEAFSDRIQEKGLKLEAREILRPANPALEPIYYDSGMPVSDYVALATKYADVDCIVSFVGPPIVDPLSPVLDPSFPPLVIISSDMYGLSELLRNGTVAWAVAPRIGAGGSGEAPPATAREWFDRYYRVYSAADADDLM